MTHALRNQYLQKLGIVQYVGRDLPVVAPAAVSPVAAPQVSQPISTEKQQKSMAELVNIGLEGKPQVGMRSDVMSASLAPQKGSVGGRGRKYRARGKYRAEVCSVAGQRKTIGVLIHR